MADTSHVNPLSHRGKRKLKHLPMLSATDPDRLFSISLTQKPESGLKLAEVVEFFGKPWEKLKDISRFGKFHAKFWGKSMADEEREWLNLRTRSKSHSTD